MRTRLKNQLIAVGSVGGWSRGSDARRVGLGVLAGRAGRWPPLVPNATAKPSPCEERLLCGRGLGARRGGLGTASFILVCVHEDVQSVAAGARLPRRGPCSSRRGPCS